MRSGGLPSVLIVVERWLKANFAGGGMTTPQPIMCEKKKEKGIKVNLEFHGCCRKTFLLSSVMYVSLPVLLRDKTRLRHFHSYMPLHVMVLLSASYWLLFVCVPDPSAYPSVTQGHKHTHTHKYVNLPLAQTSSGKPHTTVPSDLSSSSASCFSPPHLVRPFSLSSVFVLRCSLTLLSPHRPTRHCQEPATTAFSISLFLLLCVCVCSGYDKR